LDNALVSYYDLLAEEITYIDKLVNQGPYDDVKTGYKQTIGKLLL